MATRRFHLVTEAEAREVEPGSTIEIDQGGRITPLALETLMSRAVTVTELGPAADAALPADLAPRSNIVHVAIGSDHGGVGLKALLVEYLRRGGRVVTDY